MLVKEIISDAAALLGEEELSAAITSGEELSDEQTAKVNRLLRAYNTVVSEISTDYFPLVRCEWVEAGKTYYSDLTFNPFRIVGAKDEWGNKVNISTLSAYLVSPVKAEVEYEYQLNKLDLLSSHPYFNSRVTPRVFAYGIASEYCLVSGRYDEAGNWHGKYFSGVTGCITSRKKIKVKGRTWGV